MDAEWHWLDRTARPSVALGEYVVHLRGRGCFEASVTATLNVLIANFQRCVLNRTPSTPVADGLGGRTRVCRTRYPKLQRHDYLCAALSHRCASFTSSIMSEYDRKLTAVRRRTHTCHVDNVALTSIPYRSDSHLG